jgi:aminoglycoside phosphotransferase (APT) family kinase protein
MDFRAESIDGRLVRRLVSSQFPHWANLPIRPVRPGGWDNRIFRLGEDMIVRLPSAAEYAAQVEKEHEWLPKLAPLLPLAIPTPLALGESGHGYPWKWSIYRWLDGESATSERINDFPEFAAGLGRFLVALQRIDAKNGPSPGPHNFHRGGPLTTYDSEARQAINALRGKIDVDAATRVWESALASTWREPPVWLHGDISTGNLLLRRSRLSAVVDFGMLGVGDPACDLAIAWALFDRESRKIFRAILLLDIGTWNRGRAWALWKASIIAAGLTSTNAMDVRQAQRTIRELLGDDD